ncbi:MAG: hypothetical protein NT133_13075, partial [Alphaproteobacteria bacterium]|nr:hypothetical protein [Alphaproteobacteria bacterium]
RDFPADLARDPREANPEDARRLATLVRECANSGIARHVLLLRLSELPEARTRPHHFTLAREALLPLTGAARAQLFQLPNQDLVVVWRGETTALRTSLATLEHLFSDDPAFGADPMALASVLALPDDTELILGAVEESLRPRQPPAPPRSPGLPLDPATLHALERAIAQADMSRFARREPICRPWPEGFRLAWERRYLSDAELFDTILPERAPRADPWLFRRLTRTLDRRMLALLSASEELRGVPPFSIDLNVGNLIGPEFLRFDANLPAGLRGRVVINLRAEDIVADLATFCFARDFATARGYRLLLEDMVAEQVALLPPDRLGLDLVQLRFTQALAAARLPAALAPETVVLSRVDGAGAVARG